MSKRHFLFLGLVVLFLVGLPATIFLFQNQQEIRGRAAGGPNLATNPGCESNNTFGWFGVFATISCTTSSPHTGTYSFLVQQNGVDQYVYFDIYDSPDPVSNPQQGQQYTASAWVRSTTSTKKACLAFVLKGGVNGYTTFYPPTCPNLSTSWQQITNTVTVDRSDRTGLFIYVYEALAPTNSRDSFQVDDITLQLLNGSPTPTPTPVSTTYSISGDVFIDTNSNKVRDGAETNYTDQTATPMVHPQQAVLVVMSEAFVLLLSKVPQLPHRQFHPSPATR